MSGKMRFKINYKEGTWFAVPLHQGGYGGGVVARAKRTCILAYLFGPRRESIPKLAPYGEEVPNSLSVQNIVNQVYSQYPLPPGK
jgi:hypothetical protein